MKGTATAGKSILPRGGRIVITGGKMTKISALFTALILILLPGAAYAQKTPAVEITGGYSFVRNGLDSAALPIIPPSSGQGFSNFHANGWTVSLVENYDRSIGIEQELSGDYSSPELYGTTLSSHSFSILSGPRFSYRTRSPWTPYAHALFGYRSLKLDLPGGGSLSGSSYAMALGGGLNVHIRGPIALRLFQADYLLSRSYSATQNNLRLSAGIVFQLGRRRRY